MDPERLQQIQDLYHAAREARDGRRATILAGADAELRHEVESLLAQRTDATPLESHFLRAGMPPLAWAPDPPALAPGTGLGPYRIDGRISEGGMAEVYRATDTRLGRAVAIKRVHHQFSDRFRREARAISALNHPHICTLYDVGPDYLVMELVAGETLSARLQRGPLPRRDALRYAAQILSALADAHAHGIVHRDLKPGNIMLAQSGVKILDFGIATRAGDATATLAGAVMGTPAYMSPEQKRGVAVDARSDLYAFGCVLQEMLTGARTGTPRTRLRPRQLDRIVARALEADPSRRWQTAAEVQRALASLSPREFPRGPRWAAATRVPAIAAVSLLAAAAAALLIPGRMHRLGGTDTIIVPEFINRTGDPVFEGALRQGLSVQLEQSPFLSIVPAGQVRQVLLLMGRQPDAPLTPEVALDLCQRVGSTATIEGSIAQIGVPYQITLRAVECATGRTLVSSEADAANKDHVLEALGQAATRLRARLGESLGSVHRFDTPLAQATTPSLDALKAYSEGIRILSTGDDSGAAIAFFQHAIELDPHFALAYGALSIAHTNLGESRRAAEAARQAHALRDRSSEPERYFIDARYGKSATGNIDQATRACLAWIRTYPRSQLPRAMLAGSIYPVVGAFDQAVARGVEAIRMTPTMPIAYALVMADYIALDRVDEAWATYEQARRRKLDSAFFVPELYKLAFLRHDDAEMARLVDASRAKPEVDHTLRAYAAGTAAYRGQLRKARALADDAAAAAQRAGAGEPAVDYLARSAMPEALFGDPAEARRRADLVTQRTPSRDAQYIAALAYTFTGDAGAAEALLEELAHAFPEDTLVRFNYLPTLRARLALLRGEPAAAIEALADATPYEWGTTRSSAIDGWTSLYPAYVRGEAYLAAGDAGRAADEFRKILDHQGLALDLPTVPMARLQLARALSTMGDRAGATMAYRDLLEIWKDADPDLAIVKSARAEAARQR